MELQSIVLLINTLEPRAVIRRIEPLVARKLFFCRPDLPFELFAHLREMKARKIAFKGRK